MNNLLLLNDSILERTLFSNFITNIGHQAVPASWYDVIPNCWQELQKSRKELKVTL